MALLLKSQKWSATQPVVNNPHVLYCATATWWENQAELRCCQMGRSNNLWSWNLLLLLVRETMKTFFKDIKIKLLCERWLGWKGKHCTPLVSGMENTLHCCFPKWFVRLKLCFSYTGLHCGLLHPLCLISKLLFFQKPGNLRLVILIWAIISEAVVSTSVRPASV